MLLQPHQQFARVSISPHPHRANSSHSNECAMVIHFDLHLIHFSCVYWPPPGECLLECFMTLLPLFFRMGLIKQPRLASSSHSCPHYYHFQLFLFCFVLGLQGYTCLWCPGDPTQGFMHARQNSTK